MEPSPHPQWLFLDLNSYFASVEQQLNPALRGKPVAVVPAMTDATCAIAASAEAKAYGIRTGTKIYDARRMCPHLVCVPARHGAYVGYHHRVLDEVIKHVPINKVWSIDELSSRLPPRLRDPAAATAVAQRLKAGLARTVGPLITCSIGVSSNSFLAKVASDMQKPDGLVFLLPPEMKDRLFRLNLTDLPGINVNMEKRLARAGINTVEALWNTSPKQARHVWGSVSGERFWYNLHGFDIPDQETHTSSIGHSRILDPELRRPEAAFMIARRLTIKAATRMRRYGFYATAFSFSVRTPDGVRWGHDRRLSPSQDNFTFLRLLDELWELMQATLAPHRLKKVSVTLHGLCRQEDITPDLFDQASATTQALVQRDETLSRMMDGINEKYGAEAIRLGVTPRTRAGHVGTKIAFSRIPDRAEFHE